MDIDQGPEPHVGILVVDDRREDLMALEGLLESREYNVVTALTAHEALRQILARDFAVILLDVMMPEMDGFELASLIKQRERSRHTPIIFLTAAGADVGSIYRAYSVGAVDYLVKPIDRDIVKAKVATFVEIFRKDARIRRQAEALREADRRERDLALAELELKSQLRYHNLCDAVPEIVWTARVSGAPDFFNRRWFEYTGQTGDEALGTGWLAAVHPDDAPSCWERWREAVGGEETFCDLCRVRRGGDGVYRWHQLRAVPERDERGTLLGWIGTLTDFEDLKRALDARDDFISVASHELKTPMTALQLNLQGLRRQVTAPNPPPSTAPPVTERVDKAIGHVQRLVRLVDELLDVSRITAGRLDLQLERCDLSDITREVAERMADQAARAGCAIRLNLGRRLVGSWDRVRVEQVITNLLTNAFRYAPGEPVEVSLEELDGRAKLRVRDAGPGIAQQDQRRIFERFERASRSRRHGGLGMGLYITREIAKAHGGTVDVSSEPGNGAEFIVELPLIASASIAAQATA
jgi:PAS domain S-box-containing protein